MISGLKIFKQRDRVMCQVFVEKLRCYPCYPSDELGFHRIIII